MPRCTNQRAASGCVLTTCTSRQGLSCLEENASNARIDFPRPAHEADKFGRNIVITNALGIATIYEYDVRGNKTYEGGGTYPVSYAYGGENSAKLLGCADAGHMFDAGHRKVAQTFLHRFHSFCRFDILLTAMLRQSSTDFIFVTNTDGIGKAQTNFAHRVRISSSMCEIPGLTDHTAVLEVGDMSFKSPKKASELKVNCAGLKAA